MSHDVSGGCAWSIYLGIAALVAMLFLLGLPILAIVIVALVILAGVAP